jgi:Mycothiol-dependent nitroreductase Rv2466c
MWFDPRCPWAWLTSRWLLEVERVRPVQVRFHVMSLTLLNEERERDAEDYAAKRAAGLAPVRIATAAEQKYGHEVLRPLYTALGTRRHVNQERFGPELFHEALVEAGLPPELAAAAEASDYDEALRASHDAGMALVGLDVGTPIVRLPGPDGQPVAFFGPVITPAPKGEAAGRLWDGTVLVAGTPGFYELKRTRDVRPSFD